MADKYDEAIAHLQANPDEIYRAWIQPNMSLDGCLFQYATPDGLRGQTEDGQVCGCLTQIRSRDFDEPLVAWTEEITEAIRNDDRLPDEITVEVSQVVVDSLPVFAEWQRRLDLEIRGGRE